MKRKLTLTISNPVYTALYNQVGRGNIAKFIENLLSSKLNLTSDPVEEGYKAMLADEIQEIEAHEWIDTENGECLPDIENEDWGAWNASR